MSAILHIDLHGGKQSKLDAGEMFADITSADAVNQEKLTEAINDDDFPKKAKQEALDLPSPVPLEQDDREASGMLLASLCAVSALEGADTALLPAVFFALQRDLKLDLTTLATMALAQGVTSSIAAPFWGILADRAILQRKTIIILGCVMQGLVTMSLAFVDGFLPMICLRVLNGIMLASLRPVAHGIIADVTSESKRGKVFGFVQLSTNAGMMVGGLIGTPLSTKHVAGLQGWRLAFLVAGGLSAILGLVISLTMKEPPRETSTGLANSKERSAFKEEAMKLLSYFRMPTFCALIFQGWFGGIPWSAMNYTTLFYQVGGISDGSAAILSAVGMVTGAVGGCLGGQIGDCMSRAMPNHGRPLTAQISVMAGIPIAYLTFMVDPPSSESGAFIYYLSLVIFLGLTASWCGVGVNLPILTEIVRPEGRSTILAWEAALESTFATLLGNSLVGFLAGMFGYKLQDVGGSTVMDLDSRKALGKALTLTCFVPWLICWLAYSLLHWSYPSDLRRVRQEKAAERELALQKQRVEEDAGDDANPNMDCSFPKADSNPNLELSLQEEEPISPHEGMMLLKETKRAHLVDESPVSEHVTQVMDENVAATFDTIHEGDEEDEHHPRMLNN